jgi:hypothetical protein
VGETQNRPFQLSFNSWLKVDFQGARVTSDGGLLLVRELDERLGFGQLIERHLTDGRGRLIKHARYYWLLLAEGHLTRRLFAGMLRKIAALPSPAG